MEASKIAMLIAVGASRSNGIDRRELTMRFLVAVLCTVTLLFSTSTQAQQVGDRIQLIERAIGIPGHPGPGINAVSNRYPGRSIVEVIDHDQATGWFEVVDTAGNAHWITSTYILTVVAAVQPPTGLCYRVGTWNLENFGFNKSRGFPENTFGGSTFPPRTPAELAAIAAVIRDELDAKILILNEINGSGTGAGATSAELDTLVALLGPTFDYVIGSSGGPRRVALVYDTSFARPNAITEIAVPFIRINGKDIFDRNPLVGFFTLLHEGTDQNDLVVVGLHLASGQQRTANHDAAMDRLLVELEQLRAGGTVIPANEFDILIGGDLNASAFDNKVEEFFQEMDQGDWDVMADAPYPATRLAGNPLQPKSQIDYLIATRSSVTQAGLVGQELSPGTLTVHQDLADNDWVQFRQTFSDHFPVTACVSVGVDND